MAELLLELFSEEIPAVMQSSAAAELKHRTLAALKEAGLAHDGAEAFATPRRLALVARGIPETQPDRREERRGPRVDAPEKAIRGFLRAAGVKREDCEERQGERGTFLFAVIERKGRATAEVLAEILPQAIAEVPWPKSMRWGTTTFRWIRPLKSIIAIFDGEVIPSGLNIGPITFAEPLPELSDHVGTEQMPFTRFTCGHRFHAPEPFAVADFDDYAEKLAEAYVVLDPAKRRAMIKSDAEALAAGEGLTLIPDEALLDELAGLVEWPVALLGRMAERFLALPREVTIAAMRTHQRYLALCREDGSLAPAFIAIANLEAADGGASIIAGNERVLTARLADAEYFWQTDSKLRLEDRLPALDDMVFHARLGSLGDKARRIAALAGEIAALVPGAEADHCRAAALLAKADLTSGMVGEFPELQGIMGGHYAVRQGERPEVAAAIAEHYQPQGPNDARPTAPTSVAVALADKLDTLVGFFAIGEVPTGSRDPFALRRAALGLIRIVLENALRLPLTKAIREAASLYHSSGKLPKGDVDPAPLLDFFADRLKVHLREQGVRHDLIAAVFALGREDDLVRLMARVEALKSFLESDDGSNLLTAYRRAVNIVRIEERKDGARYDGAVDEGLLSQTEERALYKALRKTGSASASALEAEEYAQAMTALAKLRQPVDAFFDEVTVNAEDTAARRNRLALLSRIRETLHQVADFSQIEG